MYTDPIDSIIHTYDNRSSILKLREHIDQTEIFSFNKINITEIDL